MHATVRATRLASWLIACLVAGCASIPRYVPDLAPGGAPPVVLDSPHGPLSPERSRAVIERLRARSPDSDVLGHHLAIEQEITGSPLTTGNRVTLLRDGPATYEAMFEAIAAARERIDMETYIMEDDAIGRRFGDALAARRREGVRVRLLHDSVGTIDTPAASFRGLRDAGVEVVEFNPVNPLKAGRGWQLNHRDHRKLLLTDGRIAFLGGVNISAVYSSSGYGAGSGPSRGQADGEARGGDGANGGWHDTDLRLEGPVVLELQRLFEESWTSQQPSAQAPGDAAAAAASPVPAAAPAPAPAAAASAPAAGTSIVRAVGSSPDQPWSLMFSALLSAIDSAEISVHLTNAYFAPAPELLDALEAAARRGVDVALVLPAQTDSWLVTQAGHQSYDRLLVAGVKIHERRGRMLHSKTAVVDGVWATVGSTNLDWRSALHNQEVDAIVLGPELAGALEALFRDDVAHSEEITLERWRRRGLQARVGELFARVWAWWL